MRSYLFIPLLAMGTVLYGADLAELQRKITNNPREIVEQLVAYKKELAGIMQEAYIKNHNDSYAIFCTSEKFWDAASEECPIAALSECTTLESGRSCPFNRLTNPTYRKKYEKRVVQRLIEQIDRKAGKTVHYVSFGSGRLFQDFIILSKALSERPHASITVHAIDMLYSNVIKIFTALQDKDLGPLDQRKRWDAVYDGTKDIFSDISNAEKAKRLRTATSLVFFYSIRMANQFTNTLRTTFNKATIELHLYDEIDSFTRKIARDDSMGWPDLITTADIQDNKSICAFGPEIYQYLCNVTLQKNPQSANLWLVEERNQGVHLLGYFKANGDSPEKLREYIEVIKQPGFFGSLVKRAKKFAGYK